MRFILALVPAKKYMLACIHAAQGAFAPLCDGYLLEEGKSFPHVTICSFHCEDEQQLAQIWEDLNDLRRSSVTVRVLGLMLKKGKIPPHHYSVGLAVARDTPILQFHYRAVDLLHSHDIKCLNPSMELYQPHLTLGGISWLPSSSLVLSSMIDELITFTTEPFYLVLGRGDDIGQYLQTLYQDAGIEQPSSKHKKSRKRTALKYGRC